MKTNRKIIEINEALCNGCGQCVPSCHEGAIQVIDGKARLVAERYCDGLGACLGECPTGALQVVEREADDFDEAAVQVHLKRQRAPQAPAGGCPSAQLRTFTAGGCPSAQARTFAAGAVPVATADAPAASGLTHWPVQIRLVPPGAPFLQGANLLVVADCVPVAYPRFQQDLLSGRTVMMGCPKFDSAPEYVEKFAAIFAEADIRSVTVAVMQVPCCQSLPVIVKKGMEMAGRAVPGEIVVISLEGKILNRRPLTV
jgi:NAD-dependent dihydropyrimidine dehydrogenase PreA subunit